MPGDLFVVPDVGAAAALPGPPDPASAGSMLRWKSVSAGILLALTGPSATATENVVLVLDAADGTQLSYYPDAAILPWPAARGRALLSYEAGQRTQFMALDERGRPRPLGAVDGTGLHLPRPG